MKYNYHTHTRRCNHAKGSDESYVRRAIKNGYETIGFSDHCAWEYENRNFHSGMRMKTSEIADYVNSVKSLQKKYEGKIKILLGWEIEYFPKYMPWMVETLKKFGFDYVILGHHFCGEEEDDLYNAKINTLEWLNRYCDDVVAAMETGLLGYVAHPDIFMKGWKNFDENAKAVSEKIISKSIELGVPLEYNLLGVRYNEQDGRMGYPYDDFWALAGKMGATAIIGIDAHRPKHFKKNSERDEATEKLLKLGLKLTDSINLLKFD